MSSVNIKIHQQGWAYVTLDREIYEEAHRAHGAGGVGKLDKLLQAAIDSMDTEVTVTELEPGGATYEL